MKFTTTYKEILLQIENINPLQYAKTRNYLNGAVTYLSPYISRGVISVKKIADIVLAKGYPPEQIEKFLQELLWREYWQRIWQQQGDHILSDLKTKQAEVMHFEMPATIQNAATEIDAVDLAIQDFYKSGYMHNHMRMYIASIACNIGKSHWYQPAKWMYYHLLDGDIASNYLSWQWVAGTNSGKKYYCNQENINKYTNTQQSNGFLWVSYAELPLPYVPAQLQKTTILNLTTVLPPNNLPLLDPSLSTLVYNSYNLDPLWHATQKVNRVLLLEPEHFSTYPVSSKVLAFILALSQNIPALQIYTGSFDSLYHSAQTKDFIYKEHPSCTHYKGKMEPREWIAQHVTGREPSFFAFWKKAAKELYA